MYEIINIVVLLVLCTTCFFAGAAWAFDRIIK